MRNAILLFFAGFVVAQGGWWFAARQAVGGVDAGAFGGGDSMRLVLLASVEVVVATACFAIALSVAARVRTPGASAAGLCLAVVAGATTSTLTAGPFALVPRLFAGEAQALVNMIAAALVSAVFGWLVASAFRAPPDSAPPAA
jgi:hypothetical protein